jgi:hypothetical protein
MVLGIWFSALTGMRCRLLRHEPPRVELVRTPDGIHPQTAVDGDGVVHLVYFKGDPAAGDIYYTHTAASTPGFSRSLRVNTQASNVLVKGNVRGPQIAVGARGRVHVVWFGAGQTPKHPGAALYYARLNDAGTAFERERDMVDYDAGLDGGLSVAADDQRNVYVTWHGQGRDGPKGETERAVFFRRSTDAGQSFSAERRANPTRTGACGCCGMRAFVDRAGALYLLYRAAFETGRRDEVLLASRDHGATFRIVQRDAWDIDACPMSMASLSQGPTTVIAAWETADRALFARVDPQTLSVSKKFAAPSRDNAKHPVIVANPRGDMLLAWTEGTGWEKGGALAWQLYDRNDAPVGAAHRVDGVPPWSLPSAYVQPDGNFTIVF